MKKTPVVMGVEEQAKDVLLNNRRIVRKRGVEYGFTCPSPYLYHWQWLWDSCFHAIALRNFDMDFAKKEIVSLMSGQWKDGRVPNMVHVRHNWRFDRIVHGTGRDTSGITQPPIIATAVSRILEVSPDAAFLEKVYEPMRRYYDWLDRCRDTESDGLIAMFHPWETGIDNSTRWDDIFDIKNFNRKKFNITKGLVMFRFNFVRYNNELMRKVSPYFVKGIDMNCYYFANQMEMSALAKRMGNTADADMFEARAEKTRSAIMSKMWDPEKKVFGDLIGKDCRFSFVPTPFSFLPMWAGIVDKETAEGIHGQITDEKRFWPRFPVTTTAIDYPAFEQDGYWRGTVWINMNWFITEALVRYGYVETAEELVERTVDLVSTGGFREYFNPFTGEGLGAKSFGWTSLVIDLINMKLENPREN